MVKTEIPDGQLFVRERPDCKQETDGKAAYCRQCNTFIGDWRGEDWNLVYKHIMTLRFDVSDVATPQACRKTAVMVNTRDLSGASTDAVTCGFCAALEMGHRQTPKVRDVRRPVTPTASSTNAHRPSRPQVGPSTWQASALRLEI